MRYIAVVLAFSLLAVGLLYHASQIQPEMGGSLLSEDDQITVAAPGDGVRQARASVTRHEERKLVQSASAISPPSIETATPPHVSGVQMAFAESAYSAEPVDAEWSARTWKTVIDSLGAFRGGLSTAIVDCRSSTCRVELVSSSTLTDESAERYRAEVKIWIKEVMKRAGFHQAKTVSRADRLSSLLYFSREAIGPGSPLAVPPEVAESLREAIRADREVILGQTGEGNIITSEDNGSRQ